MTESFRHLPAIRDRRALLNRHLLWLTLAHILDLLLWVELSSLPAPNPRWVFGLCLLTGLIWLWLAVTLGRRFLLWSEHGRQRSSS